MILLLELCSMKSLYHVLKDLNQTSFLFLLGESFSESFSSMQTRNKHLINFTKFIPSHGLNFRFSSNLQS